MTEDAVTAAILRLLRAAHHAYCHDTGCFDGDDISQPELKATITEELAAVERWARKDEHDEICDCGRDD